MKNYIQQQLPPGLEDFNIEVYAYGHELKAIYNGNKINFLDLPENILELFRTDLVQNKEAIKAFVNMNITDEKSMLIQYAWCNYGGWNRQPDYCDNKLQNEYWDCGSRGKCIYEGKMCRALNIDHKAISKRELQIIKLIAHGYADKEMADMLNTACNTMKKHRQNIETKLNARSKVDVATFAHKNNLI